MNQNLYQPINGEVVDIVDESPTIKSFVVVPEKPFSFKTGQFVELTLPGEGEAPFTPSSSPAQTDKMDITIMKAGRITGLLHECKTGQKIGVRGPYGNGYPIDDFAGKELLVVGGGCGFAPLRSLMYELFRRSQEFKKLLFRGGCRTPKDFLYRNQIEEWSKRDDLDMQLTVDEGDGDWQGNVGVVTTVLDGLEMDIVSGIAIVCGPPIMMKFATMKLIDLGFKKSNLYLSMEKNMSCGFGKCGHCRLGTYYTCKDGPVFRYDKISDYPNIWD